VIASHDRAFLSEVGFDRTIDLNPGAESLVTPERQSR
jgi:hypothetical protein